MFFIFCTTCLQHEINYNLNALSMRVNTAVEPWTIWDVATHKQYPCRQKRPTLIPMTRQCYTTAYIYVSEIIFIYLQFTLPHTKPWGSLLNYKGTEDKMGSEVWLHYFTPHIQYIHVLDIDTYTVHPQNVIYLYTRRKRLSLCYTHTLFTGENTDVFGLKGKTSLWGRTLLTWEFIGSTFVSWWSNFHVFLFLWLKVINKLMKSMKSILSRQIKNHKHIILFCHLLHYLLW